MKFHLKIIGLTPTGKDALCTVNQPKMDFAASPGK